MKKILAICGLALALTGCADEPVMVPAPTAYALPPKMMLNVKVINLADRSGKQQMNSPYKNNDFNPTIAEAMKQWAGDRLQAVGTNGQAIIVIKDAALIAQSLFTSDSIDTWFTRQQGLKYTGHAEISLEATAAPGFAMADASATRSVTLPEHPSAEERRQAYYTLLNGLMRDLGQNMDASIQAHMSDFLVSSPTYGVSAIPTAPTTSSTGMMNPAPMTDSAVFVPPMDDVVVPTNATDNYAIHPAPLNQPSIRPSTMQPVAVGMPQAVAPAPTPSNSSAHVMEIPLSGPSARSSVTP